MNQSFFISLISVFTQSTAFDTLPDVNRVDHALVKLAESLTMLPPHFRHHLLGKAASARKLGKTLFRFFLWPSWRHTVAAFCLGRSSNFQISRCGLTFANIRPSICFLDFDFFILHFFSFFFKFHLFLFWR